MASTRTIQDDVPGYPDGAARALEAVELIAGSYGKKELGGKAKGLREGMGG